MLAPGLGVAHRAPVVALDAGHFAEKPGTHSASGREEREFNGRFVEVLAGELQSLGIESMRIPSVASLVQRARAADHADLLLSIHHDSMKEEYLPRASEFAGYSLFISRRQRPWHLQRALGCAQSISRAVGSTGRNFTTHHAAGIAGENRPWADRSLGIYAYDDLIILHSARVPAVLMEIAVIPNPAEEQLASDPQWVQAQAHAIAAGIAVCLRHH